VLVNKPIRKFTFHHHFLCFLPPNHSLKRTPGEIDGLFDLQRLPRFDAGARLR